MHHFLSFTVERFLYFKKFALVDVQCVKATLPTVQVPVDTQLILGTTKTTNNKQKKSDKIIPPSTCKHTHVPVNGNTYQSHPSWDPPVVLVAASGR